MLDLNDVPTLEWLLARSVRSVLNQRQRAAFSGQRVLITGAGGSVGSELARKVAATGPEALLLVDQSEYGLFNVVRELRERWPAVLTQPVLADVTRRATIRRCCRTAAPDIVFHAAAYKHVGMVEEAVCAAVATNVLGSYYTAQAARACGARFVLVSTDKASHPHSVMGASKRLAERLTLSLADRGYGPRVVRFGNVLGSSGSVVELFLHRISQGRPVQITDSRASRFFMSVGEAADLVMLVDQIATNPGLYWLDMGEPVEIVQLAQRLIALTSGRGSVAVPIEFTGLRPGEKLTEEFPTAEVEPFVTSPSRIFRLRPSDALQDPVGVVRQLQHVVATGAADAALAALRAAVPEFVPSGQAIAAAAGPVPTTRAA